MSSKKNLISKTLGGLMETLNPNHVDLDLYYLIGWSNSQTHILYIRFHQLLQTVLLL